MLRKLMWCCAAAAVVVAAGVYFTADYASRHTDSLVGRCLVASFESCTRYNPVFALSQAVAERTCEAMHPRTRKMVATTTPAHPATVCPVQGGAEVREVPPCCRKEAEAMPKPRMLGEIKIQPEEHCVPAEPKGACPEDAEDFTPLAEICPVPDLPQASEACRVPDTMPPADEPAAVPDTMPPADNALPEFSGQLFRWWPGLFGCESPSCYEGCDEDHVTLHGVRVLRCYTEGGAGDPADQVEFDSILREQGCCTEPGVMKYLTLFGVRVLRCYTEAGVGMPCTPAGSEEECEKGVEETPKCPDCDAPYHHSCPSSGCCPYSGKCPPCEPCLPPAAKPKKGGDEESCEPPSKSLKPGCGKRSGTGVDTMEFRPSDARRPQDFDVIPY
jgi:hypothetical protein